MELPVSDRLFRHAFSTQQSAREPAENFLPPAYRRRIAGARVSVECSSYVDQALLFLKYLSRRIDRAAARVLLEAMHREPLTPELREFFQSCYREMAARKEAEEIAVLNTLR